MKLSVAVDLICAVARMAGRSDHRVSNLILAVAVNTHIWPRDTGILGATDSHNFGKFVAERADRKNITRLSIARTLRL